MQKLSQQLETFFSDLRKTSESFATFRKSITKTSGPPCKGDLGMKSEWVDRGGSIGSAAPEFEDVQDAGEPWPQPGTLPEMTPVASGFFSIPGVETYHPSRIPLADPINHPPHYTFGKIEVIDVIEDWGLSFHLAQVVKYVARSKHKGKELEDLRKAKWFLDRLIASLEK